MRIQHIVNGRCNVMQWLRAWDLELHCLGSNASSVNGQFCDPGKLLNLYSLDFLICNMDTYHSDNFII